MQTRVEGHLQRGWVGVGIEVLVAEGLRVDAGQRYQDKHSLRPGLKRSKLDGRRLDMHHISMLMWIGFLIWYLSDTPGGMLVIVENRPANNTDQIGAHSQVRLDVVVLEIWVHMQTCQAEKVTLQNSISVYV